MPPMPPPEFAQFMGQKSILLGEPSIGKTLFSCRFLQFLLEHGTQPENISVLEFGPKKFQKGSLSIGGKISDYLVEVFQKQQMDDNVLARVHWVENECVAVNAKNKFIPIPQICPPRAKAANAQEVFKNAAQNFQNTHRQLLYFLAHPSPILLINDVGIHLHLGGIHDIIQACNKSQTVVLNAYFGKALLEDYGTNISWREQLLLKFIVRRMNAYQNTLFF